MINIELTGEEQVHRGLSQIPFLVLQALQREMIGKTENLAHYVRMQKLNGQVLNYRSGALFRSIQAKTNTDGTTVTGRVFSAGDVKYARFWEYGGNIPAHTVTAKNAKALVFTVGGKTIFAKTVNIPSRTEAARPFLRPSLAENKDQIIAGIQAAAIEAVRKAMP